MAGKPLEFRVGDDVTFSMPIQGNIPPYPYMRLIMEGTLARVERFDPPGKDPPDQVFVRLYRPDMLGMPIVVLADIPYRSAMDYSYRILRPLREIRTPSWYRQGMSEEEYERHTTATLVGERDMFLDLPDDRLEYILERLPPDF